MMRCKLFFIALGLMLAGCAQHRAPARDADPAAAIQAPADAPFAPWLQAERERVAQERSAVQQRYADEELKCWKRFAVNDCLIEAKRQRRTALDALRQQDLQLSALERERRTAERLRGIEQKAAPASAPAPASVERSQ